MNDADRPQAAGVLSILLALVLLAAACAGESLTIGTPEEGVEAIKSRFKQVEDCRTDSFESLGMGGEGGLAFCSVLIRNRWIGVSILAYGAQSGAVPGNLGDFACSGGSAAGLEETVIYEDGQDWAALVMTSRMEPRVSESEANEVAGGLKSSIWGCPKVSETPSDLPT